MIKLNTKARIAFGQIGLLASVLLSASFAGNSRMQRLIDRFLAQLNDQVQAMQTAWQAGDLQRLAAGAQWLKGAGGTLGFDVFTEPAQELEACASNAEREAIPPLLATLTQMNRRAQQPAPAANTETETTARCMSFG